MMRRHRYRRAERRLLEERARIVEQLEALDEEVLSAAAGERASWFAEPGDLDDGAEWMDREISSTVAERCIAELHAVDDALRVLYADPRRFGRCIECGRTIPSGRLDVIPWATRCEAHQAALAG